MVSWFVAVMFHHRHTFIRSLHPSSQQMLGRSQPVSGLMGLDCPVRKPSADTTKHCRLEHFLYTYSVFFIFVQLFRFIVRLQT